MATINPPPIHDLKSVSFSVQEWIRNVSTLLNNSGLLPVTGGGTGISSYSVGDMLYASATTTLSKLAAGTNTHILTMAAGLPSWAAPAVPTTITVADAGGDTTTFPMLATDATGSIAPKTDLGLTYNATTNALTTTTFVGALTGNASTATALQTARTIGGVSFDGTANIVPTEITVEVAGGNNTTLLHFDGADGSSTFTDSGTSPVTWTRTGATVEIDTAQSKFGGASLRGDVNDIIETLVFPDVNRTGNWTIDFWFRTTDVSDDQGFLFIGDGNGAIAIEYWAPTMILYLDSTDSLPPDIANFVAGTKTNFANNTWYHVALVRDLSAGKYYLYVDGVKDIEITSALDVAQSSYAFMPYYGPELWMDEFRISTACEFPGGTTFTPPTEAYSGLSTLYPMMVDATSGDLSPVTDSGLSYNPTTDALTATTFVGAVTGTASVATTVTVADTTDSTCSVALFESATGNLPAKTDAGITYNASAGQLALPTNGSGAGIAIGSTPVQWYDEGTGWSRIVTNGASYGITSAYFSWTDSGHPATADKILFHPTGPSLVLSGAAPKITFQTAGHTPYTNIVGNSITSNVEFEDGIYVATLVELGHATDTTLTRASAGVVAIEGSNILTASGIGSITQAWDAGLDDIASLAVTDGNVIVGNGTNWVAESGNTARTSLGLGTGDSPTFTGVTITGGTVTNNTPPLNITQTWNDGTEAFYGITINVTDTASTAASAVQRWQVGGVTIAEQRSIGGLRILNIVGTGATQNAYNATTTFPSTAITAVEGFRSLPTLADSGGAVTYASVQHYRALNTTKSGTGDALTKQVGFHAAALTTGATNYGFEGLLTSSGSARWNFYASGDAPNALAGNLRIGSVVLPTVALDVTGSGLISGTLGVSGALTAASVNGNTITTGTGVLTLGAGKTLTASNTVTLTATDGVTLAIGSGAALSAVGALTPAADKVPYFTSSSVAALADFPSVGRTLVAQTTQALARSTGLGLDTLTQPLMNYGGLNFNGTTTYLDSNALTGIAGGKKGSIVAVLRFGGAASTDERIIQLSNSRFIFRRNSTGTLTVSAANAASTTILSKTTTGTPCSAAGTYVIMVSWDLNSGGQAFQCYVNDVAFATGAGTYTDDTIDYIDTEWSIGGTATGTLLLTGDMYSLWFDPTTAQDFSSAAVRRKFTDANNVPQFLGRNGELPTGTLPVLFLGYDSAAQWPINRGSAQSTTFTQNGTIAAASTTLYGQWAPMSSVGIIKTVTADYTVGITDRYIISNRGATNTLTLLAAGSYKDRELWIRNIGGANTVISASSNVVPIAGGAAGTAILNATDGAWAHLVSDGTNWQIMSGVGTA